jgi:hypothetical protein
MLELTVASLNYDKVPAIVLNYLDDFLDLHPNYTDLGVILYTIAARIPPPARQTIFSMWKK